MSINKALPLGEPLGGLMKKYIFFLLAAIATLFSSNAFAESLSVPLFLNYGSLLYDDGGNLIPTGPIGITFKITDDAGNVLFEEYQTPDVVNGAVSAIVGNGLNSYNSPSAGVPISVFTPDGTRYLEVTVDNYPPQGLMEIVSVPYSIYAQKAFSVADESIGTSQIAKNVITRDHLTDALMTELATELSGGSTIATVTDLTTMQTTYKSKTGAESIGITPGFIYSSGVNVQEVLRDLDRAIQMRQVRIDEVGDGVGDVSAEIDAHAISTNTHGLVAGSSIVGTTDEQELTNKILGTTSMSGRLVMGGNRIENLGDPANPDDAISLAQANTRYATQTELDTHAGTSSGVHGISGGAAVVSTTDSQTLTNKTLVNPTIVGGTVTGDLAVNPGVMIDGHFVGSELVNHEGRITELERGEEPAPQISAWGTVTINEGPSISYNGHNISSVVSAGSAGKYRVSFTNIMSGTNYAVVATNGTGLGNVAMVENKTASNFVVTTNIGIPSYPIKFDFIVTSGP